jgi:hypothetical protein
MRRLSSVLDNQDTASIRGLYNNTHDRNTYIQHELPYFCQHQQHHQIAINVALCVLRRSLRDPSIITAMSDPWYITMLVGRFLKPDHAQKNRSRTGQFFGAVPPPGSGNERAATSQPPSFFER